MAAFAQIGFCLLMSKTFRPWTIDQPLLLPPSVQDFVGEDHLARFILALVLEPLDLGEIEAAYASERGQPPFDPASTKSGDEGAGAIHSRTSTGTSGSYA